MIAYAQLIELGVAPRSISTARRWGGCIASIWRSTRSLLRGARPRLAAEHAALLACGPGAVISHWSAAWLHGLSERQPLPVEMTRHRGPARVDAEGLAVHRTGTLERADRT